MINTAVLGFAQCAQRGLRLREHQFSMKTTNYHLTSFKFSHSTSLTHNIKTMTNQFLLLPIQFFAKYSNLIICKCPSMFTFCCSWESLFYSLFFPPSLPVLVPLKIVQVIKLYFTFYCFCFVLPTSVQCANIM